MLLTILHYNLVVIHGGWLCLCLQFSRINYEPNPSPNLTILPYNLVVIHGGWLCF